MASSSCSAKQKYGPTSTLSRPHMRGRDEQFVTLLHASNGRPIDTLAKGDSPKPANSGPAYPGSIWRIHEVHWRLRVWLASDEQSHYATHSPADQSPGSRAAVVASRCSIAFCKNTAMLSLPGVVMYSTKTQPCPLQVASLRRFHPALARLWLNVPASTSVVVNGRSRLTRQAAGELRRRISRD